MGDLEAVPQAEGDAAQQRTADSGEGGGGEQKGELAAYVGAVNGKTNPRPPGWKKRLRIGIAAPSKTPCPNRVSVFEKAVRCFAENPTENVITLVLGTTFNSVAEAYDFYNLYSWEKGFGIRYGKSRLNVERTKCMQDIVCGCSGKAGVENTKSCRGP